MHLASWLSDFDLFCSVCVVFGPLVFSPENGGGGGQDTLAPPPGSAPVIACAYQLGDQYKDDVAIYSSKYSQRSYHSAGHFEISILYNFINICT